MSSSSPSSNRLPPALLVFSACVGHVAYTFAGYPALVALLSKVNPRPVRREPGYTPRVSLVIAAYNEEEIIESKLENTARLDYPYDRLEVIVVADGSDDRTAELASAFAGPFGAPNVLHRPERLGKLAAMNHAAEAAAGEILVFSDANNHYTRDTLRELAAPFADPDVGIVTGRKAIDDGHGRPLDTAEGLYWRYESRIKTWESAIGSVTGVAGEVLAFRRAAFVSPRAGTMNEDFAQAMLAAAAGWRVAYAPGAVSLERASATIGDEAARRSRLVTGRGQALWQLLPLIARRDRKLAWQVVSHKAMRPLVPLSLVGAAASNVVLARQRPWTQVLLAAQALLYVAAALGWHGERNGRRNRWLYLPYYFCRMNLATLEGLRNFATRRHEAVWAKVRRG